ncbi:MAG: hypothetical protein LBK50_03130, partial [Candidatus Nomurabacteria bacterium]|nr:hypothetical protein [Candidatus Nomurabacteria bacterium]
MLTLISIPLILTSTKGKGTTSSNWYKADSSKVLYNSSSIATTRSDNIIVDLDPNLIPIVYGATGTEGSDVASTEWCNYDEQKWCNAVSVSSSTLSAYQSDPIGTAIMEEDILAYWVYVPRYAYEVQRNDAVDEPIQTQSTQPISSAINDFGYKSSMQTFTVQQAGTYKLEVWGAQGANDIGASGGRGGYSVGTIALSAGQTLNIYTGGSGGYNGGGTGGYGVTGGGGTDIRIGGSVFTNRIIVAGGGGAAACGVDGGYGGGLSGGGSGGTQASGAAFGSGGSNNYEYENSTYFEWGVGGGGGWYGGYSGIGAQYKDGDQCMSSSNSSGGGGSGYVSSSLTNAQTIAGDGNTSFPAPAGGTETGHSGNGYVRITQLHSVEAGYNIKFENANTLKKYPVLTCSTRGTGNAVTGNGAINKDYSGYATTADTSDDCNTSGSTARTYPTVATPGQEGVSGAGLNDSTTWSTHPAFTFGDEEEKKRLLTKQ